MLYALARPLLFALDPERAHELTLGLADAPLRLGLLRVPRVPGAPVRAMGLEFPNAVGLAAGLDKNAEHVDALARLGFGFLEVGTVTPRPQPGNPRPRLFRLPAAQALINRMGFNSAGLDAFMDNLGRSHWRGVLGINIGKNADTPIERAADDYAACLERVYARASYVTVNVSSPNTRNLRDLQSADSLDALLGRLAAQRERLAERHGRRVPLALKVAPELDAAQVQAVANAVRRHRIEGVIATNTSTAREGVQGLPHAEEAGGLSGAPIRARATATLAAFAAALRGEADLIGVGGILRGADAAHKLDAGASLVQLYTGLVYRGPALVAECILACRKRSRTASSASA
ncbi:MAG: quinone-dependent dihydroorotate dehydrogenase [Betaproteobacteria bacterium]|nr:quinone-dependent dihydroorotate dehydrogenase [Betaproteobacteria bacterium]MDH5222210.1 quinone-dependent dihydroorotate dehydrogenase [Betaproteobacteria bacterium]MDH5351597.1 quinone-dependent dihydroorotate dehydrogenase [Betaproteobacteria bacterium]